MKYCISVRGPKLWNKFLQSKKGKFSPTRFFRDGKMDFKVEAMEH